MRGGGVRLSLAGAACALAMSCAPAQARVLRAESVLPPGQSGFVSLTGLTDGSGSPHLYDQLSLFTAFGLKPDTFNQPGDAETPKPGVRIVRDSYGVPAVTGQTDADVWWGAGYAIAQDRLFELELFRHATEGRLSEIAGPSRLADDRIVRQDLYTPAELQQQFDALPAQLQARFDAYRDGINAWIDHVKVSPTDLPGEYPAVGLTTPAPWTTIDSVAIGVYLARTIPTNADPEGLELANLRALQLSGARRFDRVIPLRTPGSLTTIPRASGVFPSQPGRTRRQERAAFRRSIAFARGLPFPPAPAATATAGRTILGHTGGSYMFAVRRPSDHHAILFNGPQLGFSAPEKLIELELHGPGLDIRGVTAPGAPVIGAGQNGAIAWGITTGASDAEDLYAEQLVPGHPEQYMFRGRVMNMDCRDEQIRYQSPPSSLLPLLSGKLPPTPQSGTETRRECRTLHGPVEARAGNIAYARRYAGWNRELQTLEGLSALNAAQDIHQADTAIRKVTWNENVIAIDSAGNIGYWHPGLLPLKPRGWDERLPYPGTGEAEWRGLLDRNRQIPAVIDPKQGWLANWNNLPSAGWTAGDATARKRTDGAFFRVNLLIGQVRALARNPTYESARAAVRVTGTTAQQFGVDRGRLVRAARGLSERGARTVLTTLASWDGNYDRTAADGTVDPGVAAWDAFRSAAEQVDQPRVGPGAPYFADENALSALLPGYHAAAPYHYFDATHLQSYALRTLPREGYRLAAQRAFDALTKRFGSADSSRWREPRRQFDFTGLAAESPPPLPFFDRGTWEQFVETGP